MHLYGIVDGSCSLRNLTHHSAATTITCNNTRLGNLEKKNGEFHITVRNIENETGESISSSVKEYQKTNHQSRY